MIALHTLTFQDNKTYEIQSNIASEGRSLEAKAEAKSDNNWYHILTIPNFSCGHLNISLSNNEGILLQTLGIEYSGIINGKTATYQTHNLMDTDTTISIFEIGISPVDNNLCNFYIHVKNENENSVNINLSMNYSGRVSYYNYKSGNIINTLEPINPETNTLLKIKLKQSSNLIYSLDPNNISEAITIDDILKRIIALEERPTIYSGESIDGFGNQGKTGDIFIITPSTISNEEN